MQPPEGTRAPLNPQSPQGRGREQRGTSSTGGQTSSGTGQSATGPVFLIPLEAHFFTHNTSDNKCKVFPPNINSPVLQALAECPTAPAQL